MTEKRLNIINAETLLAREFPFRDRIGHWRFDAELLTLEFTAGEVSYQVDLETCESSAGVLDWILQMYEAPWCTAQDLQDFLALFDEVCHHHFGRWAPRVFCPLGQNRAVNWQAKTTQPCHRNGRVRGRTKGPS